MINEAANLNSFQRKRYIAGLCICCGANRDPGSQKCSSCRKLASDRTSKYFERRNANGLCGLCGKDKAEVYTTRKICMDCWFKNMARRAMGDKNKYIQVKELFYAQDKKCAYTGEELLPGINASLDHIVPRSKGGSDDISNLQWITKKQNVKKNSHQDYDPNSDNKKERKEYTRKYETRAGQRHSKIIMAKIPEQDYDRIHTAKEESGLTWAAFILRLISMIPIHEAKSAGRSAKRRAARNANRL